MSRYQEEFEAEREELATKVDQTERDNRQLRSQVNELKAKIVSGKLLVAADARNISSRK